MLSPEQIHERQFRLVRQTTAYDMDDVDAFLEEVEAEVVRLTAELEAVKAAGTGAGARAATAGTSDMVQLLQVAQRAADEHVEQARRTADGIVAAAQQRAAEDLAKLEVRRAELEAQQEGLAVQRGQLEANVAKLRALESELRARLGEFLEGQLQELRAFGAGGFPAP
ncbi:MAG: DivIVA domain-containing protein [Candidatus Nanopelagicales bacterium]